VNVFFFAKFVTQLCIAILQLLASHFRLFRHFALKQDFFPSSQVSSANFNRDSSYSADSAVVMTLSRSLAEANEDTPYERQFSNLTDFYLDRAPRNPFRGVSRPKHSSTSRSIDSFTTTEIRETEPA
jgi:hypothetical protein